MIARSNAARRRLFALILVVAGALLAGCAGSTPPTATTGSPAPSASVAANAIRIGAVFPISSNAGDLAGPELAGVRIAADLVNADGGVAGRPIELVVRNLATRADASAVMADLKAQGIEIVVGAYSSDLSIAASQAANDAGLVYWETGAVADRLTGRGLPLVFRVGATGSNLGDNSATFAVGELAPRLGKPAGTLRIAIAAAGDDYATSVADAADATARALGSPVVSRVSYSASAPNWPVVMSQLAAARPDVLILASHIPDGVAFRRAMLAANLHVGALIGSTMAECDPDFAGDLGPDAIGIFASDRPTAAFNAAALSADAGATYDRFAAAWTTTPKPSGPAAGDGSGSGEGSDTPGAYGGRSDDEYVIHGPAETASAEQDEEALAGFSAAWALFHDVLPDAARAGSLSPSAVADAARAIDLPEGALPNGAGLRFSTDPARLGQNERAAAVIWQWQAERTYAFVWPPTYATGNVAFVPLER